MHRYFYYASPNAFSTGLFTSVTYYVMARVNYPQLNPSTLIDPLLPYNLVEESWEITGISVSTNRSTGI